MFEPRGITLTKYQREGIERASRVTGTYFAWACGSGKTIGAICAALNARQQACVQGKGLLPILVVTKANAKYQWKREIEKVTRQYTVQVLNGFSDELDTAEPADFYIVNWDILAERQREIIASLGKYLLIMDELHCGKSWKREEKVLIVDSSGHDRIVKQVADNRAGAIHRLSQHAAWRLGLSATPIRDRISDLWAQLDLLQPKLWGTNWAFVHRYCDAQPGKYGGLDTTGASNIDELRARVKRVMHKVTKQEASAQLPKIRREMVKLDRVQQIAARGFITELRKAKKPSSIFEIKLAMSAMSKRKWAVTETVDLLLQGQKVAVFAGRRKECEKLGQDIDKALRVALRKEGVDINSVPMWCMHGGATVKARGAGVADYASTIGAACFVGTTQAFGEAIDGLQCTDVAIITMLPWTPGEVEQLEGRFARIGGNLVDGMRIIYVIAEGTVDEQVADLILYKLAAVADVFENPEVDKLVSMFNQDDKREAIIAQMLLGE
jgi:hypothetical protein